MRLVAVGERRGLLRRRGRLGAGTVAVGVASLLALAASVTVLSRALSGSLPLLGGRGGGEDPARRGVPGTVARDGRPDSPTIVYATRRGSRVTVYQLAAGRGPASRLFEFDDGRVDLPAAPEPAPPQVALSPDGHRVAYIDRSGLRTRDLDSGEDRQVVGRVERPADAMGIPSPRWSVPEMNGSEPDPRHLTGIFAIRRPRWSPDGRFLSFVQAAYEFQGHGIVELHSGRYWADPGSSWLEWSARSTRVALAGTWFAGRGELSVSLPGDLGSYRDLRSPDGPAERSFEEAVFAPDGHRLAVAYADDDSTPPTRVALVDVDGGGLVEVGGPGEKSALAYSQDGSALVFFERRDGATVAVRYDVATAALRDLARLPAEWYSAEAVGRTADGRLAFLARSRLPGEGLVDPCDSDCPSFGARLVVLSPDSGALEPQGPILDRFTALAGISSNPAPEGR